MKKGFTLIEIILSIALVVVIGTISIFSFNIIKKNNKEKTLESMSETIFNAVNVYLESNTDVKKQLYNNKNGLKIPLTTLENSGLVDFGDLSDDLDDEDFVVTMLGSTDPNDDTCAKTYTAKSWNITDNETIYICEKSNGVTNLVQVAGPADNLSKVTREPYYLNSAFSFAKIEGIEAPFLILRINRDDSLTLISTSAFPIELKPYSDNYTEITPGNKICLGTYYDNHVRISPDTQLRFVTSDSLSNSCTSSGTYKIISGIYTYRPTVSVIATWGRYPDDYHIGEIRERLALNLKTNIKIVSGTGDSNNPYILKQIS